MNIRRLAARVYKGGVKQIAQKFSTPVAVLIYHRVIDLPLDSQLLAVSPDNFRAHLEILREFYHVLSIDEFLFYLKEGKGFPPKSVVITFDDGYYDNYTYALPILEAFHLQSLFYVSTSNLNTDNEFWWDLLEKIFFKTKNLPASLSIRINSRQLCFKTASFQDKVETYNQLHPFIKYLHPTIRDEKIIELLNWAGIENGDKLNRVMTAEELKQFSKSDSVIIGAHTHTHPALVSLSYADQLTEISTSKSILETITGQKVNHFSYPFGTKADYNAHSLKIMKHLNFAMACSNFSKLTYSWTSKYEIPRFLVRNWDKENFKKNIRGFF
jgi:peptidoglycan/xylan/chitin deacetylase (PgdA/CDA1 family)